jgi:hypothetical protein
VAALARILEATFASVPQEDIEKLVHVHHECLLARLTPRLVDAHPGLLAL